MFYLAENYIEFYDLVPHIKYDYLIIEAFIESLIWRKKETISFKLIPYINQACSKHSIILDLFRNTLLSIATVPNFCFNAHFLHRHLIKKSLGNRDAEWTQYLKEQYNFSSQTTNASNSQTVVERLIDWAWSNHDKNYILDEPIFLYSIALAWFHTSTNRKLRDSATKALVCLLENRIHILIKLLKKFNGVNDPYVYERLFAVAYACTIRTEKKEQLPILSDYIFQTIFNKQKEVYPHILLRDYARGIIEYTHYLGYKLNFDISKSQPPYHSALPDKFPSNQEIAKYKFAYRSKDFNDFHHGQNSILSSMATGSHYGDFGKYTFQSALQFWIIDANDFSNLAIKWIFEKYGYDKYKHGQFDRYIGSGRGRNTMPNERIGKKYQWLVFHEILARISDNLTMHTDRGFDRNESQIYKGTWKPKVRDIDPTLLISSIKGYNSEKPLKFWWFSEVYNDWNLDAKLWIQKKVGLPSVTKLLNVFDEKNEEWLALESMPRWREKAPIGTDIYDYPQKQIYYQIRSYLVTENEYEKMKEWVLKKRFIDISSLPKSHEQSGVFSREYYWSSAYKNNEMYRNIKHEIYDRNSGYYICNVILTSNNLLLETNCDYSIEETIRFLKPSNFIFQNIKLLPSEKEGYFNNENGNITCFSPIDKASPPCLLIKKEPFLKFLKENKLKIIWTLLGEKNILGMRQGYGRLEITGAYYLGNNNTIDGKINFK